MKIRLYLSCLSLLFAYALSAQVFQDYSRCGAEQSVFDKDPIISSYSNEKTFTGDNESIIIPAVFHIIHNGGRENISDAQIQNALEELNLNFNRLNADTLDAPLPFQAIAGKMNIQFKLASLDPDGHCSTGINRVFSSLSALGSRTELSALIHWPSDRYLNIYVQRQIPNNFVGLATFPGSAPSSDGVYMDDNFLGSIENALGFGDIYPDVLTHEVGHWLNLQHTWGPTNNPSPINGCTLDDGVEDTPLQASASRTESILANINCPNFPAISCDNAPNGDNFSNYMDYSYCSNMFTQGQVDRMCMTLNSDQSGRNNLWTEANVMFTGTDTASPTECLRAPIADFGISTYSFFACGADTDFQFFDRSWGAETESVSWLFPGGSPASSSLASPVVNYASTGLYNIQLIATNTHGSDTLNREVYIHIFPEDISYSVQTGLTEDFEADDSFEPYFLREEGIGNIVWERIALNSNNGNYSLALEMFGEEERGTIGFISPFFDLSTLASGDLSFKVAYSLKDSTNSIGFNIYQYGGAEFLDVIALYDCGEKSLRLASIPQDSLVTAPPFNQTAFFPEEDHQWKEFMVSLPEELLDRDDIQFYFRFTRSKTLIVSNARLNDYNNLFLDDINMQAVITDVAKLELSDTWTLYPNPSSTVIHLESMDGFLPCQLSIFDLHGRKLKELNINATTQSLDISGLPKGIYFCTLQSDTFRSTKKLMIN